MDVKGEKMQIIAYDDQGNTFLKELAIKESANQEPDEYGYYGDIIDFGWPCEYYINSLKKKLPFEKDLCIDIAGMNHRKSPVYISKEDMNYIFDHLEMIPKEKEKK